MQKANQNIYEYETKNRKRKSTGSSSSSSIRNNNRTRTLSHSIDIDFHRNHEKNSNNMSEHQHQYQGQYMHVDYLNLSANNRSALSEESLLLSPILKNGSGSGNGSGTDSKRRRSSARLLRRQMMMETSFETEAESEAEAEAEAEAKARVESGVVIGVDVDENHQNIGNIDVEEKNQNRRNRLLFDDGSGDGDESSLKSMSMHSMSIHSMSMSIGVQNSTISFGGGGRDSFRDSNSFTIPEHDVLMPFQLHTNNQFHGRQDDYDSSALPLPFASSPIPKTWEQDEKENQTEEEEDLQQQEVQLQNNALNTSACPSLGLGSLDSDNATRSSGGGRNRKESISISTRSDIDGDGSEEEDDDDLSYSNDADSFHSAKGGLVVNSEEGHNENVHVRDEFESADDVDDGVTRNNNVPIHDHRKRSLDAFTSPEAEDTARPSLEGERISSFVSVPMENNIITQDNDDDEGFSQRSPSPYDSHEDEDENLYTHGEAEIKEFDNSDLDVEVESEVRYDTSRTPMKVAFAPTYSGILNTLTPRKPIEEKRKGLTPRLKALRVLRNVEEEESDIASTSSDGDSGDGSNGNVLNEDEHINDHMTPRLKALRVLRNVEEYMEDNEIVDTDTPSGEDGNLVNDETNQEALMNESDERCEVVAFNSPFEGRTYNGDLEAIAENTSTPIDADGRPSDALSLTPALKSLRSKLYSTPTTTINDLGNDVPDTTTDISESASAGIQSEQDKIMTPSDQNKLPSVKTPENPVPKDERLSLTPALEAFRKKLLRATLSPLSDTPFSQGNLPTSIIKSGGLSRHEFASPASRPSFATASTLSGGSSSIRRTRRVVFDEDNSYDAQATDLSSAKKNLNAQSSALVQQLRGAAQRRMMSLTKSRDSLAAKEDLHFEKHQNGNARLSLSSITEDKTKEEVVDGTEDHTQEINSRKQFKALPVPASMNAKVKKGVPKVTKRKNTVAISPKLGKARDSGKKVPTRSNINRSSSTTKPRFKALPLPSCTGYLGGKGQSGVPKIKRRPLTVPKSPCLGVRRNPESNQSSNNTKITKRGASSSTKNPERKGDDRHESPAAIMSPSTAYDDSPLGLGFLSKTPIYKSGIKVDENTNPNIKCSFILHSTIRAKEREKFEVSRSMNEKLRNEEIKRERERILKDEYRKLERLRGSLR